jgi:hypothetical protein
MVGVSQLSTTVTDGAGPAAESIARTTKVGLGASRGVLNLEGIEPQAADPKIHGAQAGGSTRRSAAEPGPSSGWVSALGGGLEGDLVAERFELADVVALGALSVDAGVIEAGAQVAEAGGGSASRCQTMTRMERPTATMARLVPRRRAMRR